MAPRPAVVLHPAEVIALGLDYPRPDSVAVMTAAIASTHGVVRRHLEDFVQEVGALSLGEWEELHTTTLDLNPQFVPYVGHVMWGDAYRRGEFMADLKPELRRTNTELNGELPDHLALILRYLAVTGAPLDDLVQILPGTITTMTKTLKTASPKNPYLHLLAAANAFVADLRPLTIGLRR